MNYSKKMMLLASVLILMAAWQSCASKAAHAPQASTSTKVEQTVFFPSDPDDNKIYGFDEIDHRPQYNRATADIYQFLSRNLKYPEEASNKGIEGRVLVEFIIEKDGSLSNFKIKSLTDNLLNVEAIRLVKKMDPFIPAVRKGKAVRYQFIQPIVFKIQKY